MQEDKSRRQNPQALGKGELQGRLLEHGGGRRTKCFSAFPQPVFMEAPVDLASTSGGPGFSYRFLNQNDSFDVA